MGQKQFSFSAGLPVAKFFQDYEGEPDDMIRRIHQLVEVQQTREQVMDRVHDHQQKIKQAFDRKVRKKDFQLGDLVLKWDAPRQDRGKHNKFEALWIGPFKISEVFSNNTYRLQDLEGEEVFNGPSEWAFSEEVFLLSHKWLFCFVNIVFCLFLVLISDSIAQQQGTEAAKEFLASHHREQVVRWLFSIPHGA
jgi:hypothetical protein